MLLRLKAVRTRFALITLSRLIFLLASSLLFSNSTLADDHGEKPTSPTLHTKEIADNLFMISGKGGFTGGNVLLAVGDKHVVMIDDKIASMEGPLLEAVRSISDRPISFLVNTHLHKDHTGNNAALAKRHTHIVGHSNVRKRMQADTEAYAADEHPKVTYLDSMALYVADQPAILVHAPRAHTDGDSFVVFKDSNVIHTGDLFFNGLFPYIDLDSGGSVQGYIAGQKRIIRMANDNTIIVPGHGPLSNKKELTVALAMLEESAKIVAEARKNKMSLEKMKETKILERYKDYEWGFISQDKMIEQLYKDLN